MREKVAPVKTKIMVTVKNILLQEYFKTLVLFGNKEKFNHLPTYKAFQDEQTSDLENANFKDLNKETYIAKDFLEMLILTILEKLQKLIFIHSGSETSLLLGNLPTKRSSNLPTNPNRYVAHHTC